LHDLAEKHHTSIRKKGVGNTHTVGGKRSLQEENKIVITTEKRGGKWLPLVGMLIGDK